MAKRRHTASPTITPDHHVTPEGPVATAAEIDSRNDVERAFADAGMDNGHANPDAPAPSHGKKFSLLHEFLTINTPDNQVQLGKNNKHRTRNGEGAFIVYFAHNPNEGRAQDDPHPVVQHMKDAGYRWEQAPDGDRAWIKPYEHGFTIRQEMDAIDVAKEAARLLGANIEVGQSR